MLLSGLERLQMTGLQRGKELEGEWKDSETTGMHRRTQVCEKDLNLNNVFRGLKTQQKPAVSS